MRDLVVRRAQPRAVALVMMFASLGLSAGGAEAQNVVSWWSGDVDARDHVGQNHGTLEGGATIAPGKVGNAFSLDGINDVVRIKDSPSLLAITKEITIAAWINNASAVTSTIIAKKQRNCRQFMLLVVNGTGLQFSYKATNCTGAQHYYDAANVLTLNTWHHVAATYVSGVPSSMTLFVDGSPVSGSWTRGNGSVSMASLPSYVTIGADETTSGQQTRFFKGMIDEVELHHRALSPLEVRLLFLMRPDFRGDVATVSHSGQGSQVLLLNAGTQHKNKLFLVLGSLSGTTPGIQLGAVTLPLNFDAYLSLTAAIPNSPLLTGSLGTLDNAGKAATRFHAIPLIPASLIGKPFYHAYVVFGASTFDFASSAVRLALVQ